MIFKKRTKKIVFSILAIVIVALLAGGIYYYYSPQNNQVIGISGYYDSNGKKIQQGFFQQSVIGNVDGVSYITINANIVNQDKYAGNFAIINASPIEFKNALSASQPVSLNAGKGASFTSTLIPVKQWENKTVNFTVTVRATSDVRATVDKTAFLSIDVRPDMPLTFSLDVNSSLNNGQDINSPPVSSTNQFETNAASNAWASFVSGTWIRVDNTGDGVLDQYPYAAVSTCTFALDQHPLLYTTDGGVRVYKNSASTVVLTQTNVVTGVTLPCKLYGNF